MGLIFKLFSFHLDDPFDVNCLDYNECNAFKSSLWEIKSLERHFYPGVSKEIEKLYNLSQTEYELDEAFENNSYEMVIKYYYILFQN